MYKIKFNAQKFIYEIKKDGVVVKTFGTKKDASAYVKELTTDKVIFEKSEVEKITETPEGEKETIVAVVSPEETTAITADKTKEQKSTLFSLIEQETEEDGAGNSQIVKEEDDDDSDDEDDKETKAEKIAKNLIDNDDADDDEINKRQNAKLTAILIVQMCSVVFGFLCQFIAKDFSKDAEKKYTLSADKQKAIQTPLQKILELRKKKSSPITSLIVAILLSFAPMILLAFADRRKKAEDEKEAEKQVIAAENLAQQKFDLYRQNFLAEQKRLADSNNNASNNSVAADAKTVDASLKFSASNTEKPKGKRGRKPGSKNKNKAA